MRKVLLALALVASSPLLAQTTTITASSIAFGGVPIPSGTVSLTPVDRTGNPIPFVTSGGGLNLASGSVGAFACTITAGAIIQPCTVPDASLSTPVVYYSIQISDTVNRRTATLAQVPNVSGTTWPLDHYAPAANIGSTVASQYAQGVGAPSSACTSPLIYADQSPTSQGSNLWVCVSGVMVHQYGSGSGTNPTFTTNVTSLAAGATPTASITGTAPNFTLNLGLPVSGGSGSGSGGALPTFTVGQVSSLAPGATATASVSGTSPNFILNLGIPAGPAGANAATPAFTVTSTALAAGATPTATVTGTYPNLTIAFGIPASGSASSPVSTAANQVPLYTSAGSTTPTPTNLSSLALSPSNNLNDVQSPSAALTNLGAASASALATTTATANAAMPKAGGTFSGPVVASSDTPTGSQVASANFVNAQVAPASAAAAAAQTTANAALPLAGGTATGTIAAPGFKTTGTTSGFAALGSGTGSLPALPANSAAIVGPPTGGTSYALKLPANASAGVMHTAAPAVAEGINESGVTFSPVNLASDVTGALPVANGGTGVANPSLVAGSNVNVSGTWPNQTISSTGGGGGATLPASGFVVATSSTTSRAATPTDLNSLQGYTPLSPSNNLSDVASASTALTNLGGATAASVTSAASAASAAQTTANAALPKAGGTLTGTLVLAADPSTSSQASTKNYVDTQVATASTAASAAQSAATAALPKAGGTMTGSLTLAADPTASAQAATKNYVDTTTATANTNASAAQTAAAAAVPKSGGTMTGTLVLSGDPTASTQAATKNYVDTGVATANTAAAAAQTTATAALPKTGGTLTGPIVLSSDSPTNSQAASANFVNTQVATVASAGANALQVGSPATWATGTTYGKGVLVLGSDGGTYGSLVASNVGNNPTSTTGSWGRIAQGPSSYVPPGATTNALIKTNGSGAAATVDSATNLAAGILALNQMIEKSPRVNVQHFSFNGGAVGDGSTDNCTAFTQALAYAQSLTSSSLGHLNTLFFPAGVYMTSCTMRIGSGQQMVNFVGDSNGGTIIRLMPGSFNGITINHASGASGYQTPLIQDITIEGQGNSTTGTLYENAGTGNIVYNRFRLQNTAGRGFMAINGAERQYCFQCLINHVRFEGAWSGDVNESGFTMSQFDDPGLIDGNYSFNRNAVSGTIPSSGNYYPDHHATFVFEGNQLNWVDGGSTKSTYSVGGFKFHNVSLGKVKSDYFEGFVVPSLTSSVQEGGQLELSTTTAAMTTTSKVVAVTNWQWQAHFLNLPADAQAETSAHAITAAYDIFPIDFVPGSTSPSSNGVTTQGAVERIQIAAFAGDGNLYIVSRGQSATLSNGVVAGAAQAWPAGSIISPIPGVSTLVLDGDHMESVRGVDSNHTSQCNDAYAGQGQLSNSCDEIGVGYYADGYEVLTSKINNMPNQYLKVLNPETYPGALLGGAGSAKVYTASTVAYDGQYNWAASPATYATAQNTYVFGNTSVEAITYPDSGLTAGLEFSSASNGMWMSTDNDYYLSFLHYGNGSHQVAAIQASNGFAIQDIGPSGTPTVRFQVLGYPYQYPTFTWAPFNSSGVQQCGINGTVTNTTTGTVSWATCGTWNHTGDFIGSGAGNFATTTISGQATYNGAVALNGLTTATGLILARGGGIQDSSSGGFSGYSAGTSRTQGTGEAFIRYSPNSPGGTLTVLPCTSTNIGTHADYIVDPNGQPLTISGPLQINLVNYNNVTLNSGRAFRGDFECDGAAWQNKNYMPNPGNVTLTTGAGFGTITSGGLNTVGSNATAGSFSYTTSTSGTGTSGTTLLTMTFSPATYAPFAACELIPQNANAQAQVLNITAGVPTTSSVVFTMNGTALTPAQYSWGYRCVQNY